MSTKKGFTLIEFIVVLVIISILTAIAIPTYLNNQMQGAAKTAQNNLITIYNAERNFYLSNTAIAAGGSGAIPYYCSTTTQNTTCADNLADINTNLSLNITDNYFSYNCIDPNSGSDGNDGSSFFCQATNLSDNTFTLTITGTPTPVVLLGGVNCTTTSGTACNPRCTYTAHPNYCSV